MGVASRLQELRELAIHTSAQHNKSKKQVKCTSKKSKRENTNTNPLLSHHSDCD